jgi:hypothetical protein
MNDEKPCSTQLADELSQMKSEELLPVEKKLILWSLILGVVLLAVLTLVSKVLFPT